MGDSTNERGGIVTWIKDRWNHDPFKPSRDEVQVATEMLIATSKGNTARTLEHERAFMENLLVQRVNFLLVIFALFMGTAMGVGSFLASAVLFCTGAFICWVMAKIVHRAHVKHHWILQLLYEQDEPNSRFWDSTDSAIDTARRKLPYPIRFINEAMKKTVERERKTKGSVSKVVGEYLPTLCWIIMLAGAVLSGFMAWREGETQQFSEWIYGRRTEVWNVVKVKTATGVEEYHINKNTSNGECAGRITYDSDSRPISVEYCSDTGLKKIMIPKNALVELSIGAYGD